MIQYGFWYYIIIELALECKMLKPSFGISKEGPVYPLHPPQRRRILWMFPKRIQKHKSSSHFLAPSIEGEKVEKNFLTGRGGISSAIKLVISCNSCGFLCVNSISEVGLPHAEVEELAASQPACALVL